MIISIHLLFYNTKLRKKKIEKIQNRAQNFEHHHICTKTKKTKHFLFALNWTFSNIHSERSSEFLFSAANSKMISHNNRTTSQLELLSNFSSKKCEQQQKFLLPTETCNSANWWLIVYLFHISDTLPYYWDSYHECKRI